MKEKEGKVLKQKCANSDKIKVIKPTHQRRSARMLEDAHLDYQDSSKEASNGFLLAMIAFVQQIGCVAALNWVSVPMKEVKHSVQEKIVMLLLGYVVGCQSSNELARRLGAERRAAASLGLDSFVDDSSLSRLYARIDGGAVEDLRSIVQVLQEGHGLARHLTGIVLVDVDGTGLVVKGDQFEWADEGYFAKHPGAKGYQLSLAIASKAGKEVLAHLLDPGHVNSGSRFFDLLYQVGETLGFLDERLFIRADRGYGVGEAITLLRDLQIGFLIKGRDSRTAQKWVTQYGAALLWVAVDETCWVVDIGRQHMPNCPYPVRTILVRTLNEKKQEYAYSYFVTTLPATACAEADLFHFYNERVTMEKLIERCKNVWAITHLPTHHFEGLLFYVELRFLAYNLVLWYQHYVLAHDERLQAMTVFELVSTLGATAIVTEQTPQAPLGRGLLLYLAAAPPLLQALITLTHQWLQQVRSLELVLLRSFSRLHYPWSQLLFDVWQASPKPDAFLHPLLCKT
jgi:hypothetical protein